MTIRVALQSDIVVLTPDGAVFTDENDPTWQGIIYRLASARPDMIVYGCLLAFVNRAIPRPLTDRWRQADRDRRRPGLGRLLRLPGVGQPRRRVRALRRADVPGLPAAARPDDPGPVPAPGGGGVAGCCRTRRCDGSVLRSYGIYLWHIPVLFFFLAAMDGVYGPQRLVLGLIGSACGVLAGIASYRFIEQPFLRIKDRRFRRPQDESATAGDGARAREHRAAPGAAHRRGPSRRADHATAGLEPRARRCPRRQRAAGHVVPLPGADDRQARRHTDPRRHVLRAVGVPDHHAAVRGAGQAGRHLVARLLPAPGVPAVPRRLRPAGGVHACSRWWSAARTVAGCSPRRSPRRCTSTTCSSPGSASRGRCSSSCGRCRSRSSSTSCGRCC